LLSALEAVADVQVDGAGERGGEFYAAALAGAFHFSSLWLRLRSLEKDVRGVFLFKVGFV